MDIGALLDTYPRQRPPLTPAHERIYAEQYRLNRDGARPVERFAQRLERWMHERVAEVKGGPILELGAGTLNHRRYEETDIDYDIVEPFRQLFDGRPEVRQMRDLYERLSDVPRDKRYVRIISIAVLEHMTNLPQQIAHAAVRLQPNGVFQAGIPSEGGVLWWLGWRLSTGISYRVRTGLEYGTVMRHEHVNKAPEILSILRYFFGDVRLKRFPFSGHQISFYTYLEARKPDLDRCRSFVVTTTC